MKLVECELPEKKIGRAKKCQMFDLLMEFDRSNMTCAEITEWEHVSANSLADALYLALARYRFKNIKAVLRAGRVFLVRGNANG